MSLNSDPEPDLRQLISFCFVIVVTSTYSHFALSTEVHQLLSCLWKHVSTVEYSLCPFTGSPFWFSVTDSVYNQVTETQMNSLLRLPRDRISQHPTASNCLMLFNAAKAFLYNTHDHTTIVYYARLMMEFTIELFLIARNSHEYHEGIIGTAARIGLRICDYFTGEWMYTMQHEARTSWMAMSVFFNRLAEFCELDIPSGSPRSCQLTLMPRCSDGCSIDKI